MRFHLRALEPEDAHRIFLWENDPEQWDVSDLPGPVSLHLISSLCEAGPDALFQHRQQRWLAENEAGEVIGSVELFDYHPIHRTAHVGILVLKKHRFQGVGLELLQLLAGLSFNRLGIVSLVAHVRSENIGSIRLFTKAGYQTIGTLSNWYSNGATRSDAIVFQLNS